MHFQTLTIAALTLAAASLAQAELKVDVYEGPTECEDAEKVMKGKYVNMHYTGTIDESSETGEKGKQFDTSHVVGETFDFQIGTGGVIKGWDEGLVGLCKGAKATLVIPPEMGYGEQGAPGGDIPGGATLNFDVEVVDVMQDVPEGQGGPPQEENLFKNIDTNGDGKLDKDEVEEFFKSMDGTTPDDLWESEDKDKDGYISYEEFSGPKQDPRGEEL